MTYFSTHMHAHTHTHFMCMCILSVYMSTMCMSGAWRGLKRIIYNYIYFLIHPSKERDIQELGLQPYPHLTVMKMRRQNWAIVRRSKSKRHRGSGKRKVVQGGGQVVLCCVVSRRGQEMKVDCLAVFASLGTFPSSCSRRDGTKSLIKTSSNKMDSLVECLSGMCSGFGPQWSISQEWWHTPVISELRMWRQED